MRVILMLTLAAAVGQIAGAQDKGKPLPVTFSLTGGEMYTTWCASCHGTSGKGDGPAASDLKTKPTDLTMLAKIGRAHV